MPPMRGFPGECAAHWLPGCSALAQTKYLQRHNNAFKILFFEVLRSLDLITKVEPWFSQVTPKLAAVWEWACDRLLRCHIWLFADTTQVKANRIDATIIDKTSKQVRVIEMSCPWLENRDSKDFKQTTKYSQMRVELTNRYPEYKVNQYNIIMDVLGGCSKEVEKNIKELVGKLRVNQLCAKCKKQSCLVHYTLLY